MFKICLIGCGNMAHSGHGPACKTYAERYADTELSACCDLRPERTEMFCREFGFKRAYSDYREMLETEKPDAVLVIMPVPLTAEVAIDVMERGYNVIMEKPPGVSVEEAMAIHACAVKNGVHARVALNRRYMPLLRALKEEIAACGEKPVFADCQFLRVGRTDADFCTTAIHAIDSVRYILEQDYSEARFDYQEYPYKNDRVGMNFHIRALYEDGAVSNISFLPCSGCVAERIFVSCRDHAFFAELPVWNGMDMPGRVVCTTAGKRYKEIIGTHDTMYESSGFYTENEYFFNEVRAGVPPYSDVAGAAQAVAIADAMRHREREYRK